MDAKATMNTGLGACANSTVPASQVEERTRSFTSLKAPPGDRRASGKRATSFLCLFSLGKVLEKDKALIFWKSESDISFYGFCGLLKERNLIIKDAETRAEEPPSGL